MNTHPHLRSGALTPVDLCRCLIKTGFSVLQLNAVFFLFSFLQNNTNFDMAESNATYTQNINASAVYRSSFDIQSLYMIVITEMGLTYKVLVMVV